MVRSVTLVRVADWLNAYVVRNTPTRRRSAGTDGRGRPLGGPGRMAPHGRAGREKSGRARFPALLDRIEAEMADAYPEVQWTMNNTLATIGIRCPNSASGPSRSARRGRLPGLARVEGLHVPLRPDLDQRDGEPARLSEQGPVGSDSRTSLARRIFVWAFRSRTPLSLGGGTGSLPSRVSGPEKMNADDFSACTRRPVCAWWQVRFRTMMEQRLLAQAIPRGSLQSPES